MIRTKGTKRPDAILASDMHIRLDQPVCRLDDYPEAQWRKLDFIKGLQRQFKCPVLHAGDLYNHWKAWSEILTKTIQHLPANFWTVYGQHDLPQHNLSLADKCGINTLLAADKINVAGAHWGESPEDKGMTISGKSVLLWHNMVYQGKLLWPGCEASEAIKVLKKYPEFDLIVTGDNHKPFVEEYKGRLLVNPGSLGRMTADQVDHKPRVYFWYADTNTVEPHYLPIDKDVVSREHITKDQERDERIEAFISKLDGEWDAGLSFEENLERAVKANEISKEIIDIIYKAIEV